MRPPRVVLSTILVLVSFLAVGPLLAQEQDYGLEEELAAISTIEHDELEEEFELLEDQAVVYSASKHKQDIAQSPAAVTVVTREQIENSPCSSVTCVIQQLPEMEVVRFKTGFSTIGIHSFSNDTGDRVLVLIDGRVANFEITGPPFLEMMPIHLRDIERLEIIRGPASALYGANAYSAVISIFTRRTQKDGAQVLISGGSPGILDLYGRVEKTFGDWGLHASVGREEENDLLINQLPAKRVSRLRLRLDYWTKSIKATIEAGYSNPRGNLYTHMAPVDIAGSNLAYLVVSLQKDFWQARLYFSLYQAKMGIGMKLFYGGLKLGELPKFFHFLNMPSTLEWQANFKPWKGNLLIGGATYHLNPFLSPDNEPETTLEHSAGLFVHDEQTLWEQLHITLGLRLDYNSFTQFSLSPQTALVWTMGGHSIRASFGQAFRKPTMFSTSFHLKGVKGIVGVEEFFLRGFGTDNLENERITTFELGYYGRLLENRLVLETTMFYNMYRNTLAFYYHLVTNSLGIPDLKSSSMGYSNSAMEADGLGGSVSISYSPMDRLHFYGNYSYTYLYYSSPPADSPWIMPGDRVPWVPVQLASIGGDYQTIFGLRFAASFHFESSRSGATTPDGSLFGEYRPIFVPAFTFTNLLVGWRMVFQTGWIETGLRINNLFNQRYSACPYSMQGDGSYWGCQPTGREVWVYLNANL